MRQRSPLLWPTAVWGCGGKSGQTPQKRWYRPGLKQEYGKCVGAVETFQVQEVGESLVWEVGGPKAMLAGLEPDVHGF